MGKVIGATAPCSWGVWYADGTPSGTPWELFLNQAAQAGYRALELGPDGYLPQDTFQMKEELEKRGLFACAGTACYRFDQYRAFSDFKEEAKRLLARIAAMDGKYLVVMDESDVGRFSEKKEGLSAGEWADFFEMTRALKAYAAEVFGIEAVFHPHIKSMIETEAEIIRLMEHTGMRLCFDTGHHAYVNGTGRTGDRSAENFIRAHAEQIAYLHFKNISEPVFAHVQKEGLDSDTAFDLDVMCDLEDGILDYRRLKSVLEEIGFSGIGVIEQDMPRAGNEKAFVSAVRNLKYLQQIGITE